MVVFGDVGLEALGLDGGIGVEIGFDGGVDFMAHEMISAVFKDSDLDVRVEKLHQSVGVFFDMAAKVVREVLLERGRDEHQCRHHRPQIAQHLPHFLPLPLSSPCHRILRGCVISPYIYTLCLDVQKSLRKSREMGRERKVHNHPHPTTRHSEIENNFLIKIPFYNF